MRKLMISALALIASSLFALADSYQVSLPAKLSGTGGFQLVAYSFTAANLVDVFPDAVDGDQISFYNPSTATWSDYLFDGLDEEWTGNRTIYPGEAFWYRNNTAQPRTLTITGTSPSSNVSFPMTSQTYYLLGAAHLHNTEMDISCANSDPSLGWVPNDGDQISVWRAEYQAYYDYTYDGLDNVWTGVGYPTLQIGCGAWFKPASSKTWTQVPGGTSCPI